MRLRDVDELRLRARGREVPAAGVLWFAGTIGLAGLPYVGVFLGHSLIEDGATATHAGWLPPVLVFAQALSAAALFRAGARMFLGWGAAEDPMLAREPRERPPTRDAAMPVLAAVAAAAILFGLAVSVIPGLQQRSEAAAERFEDRAGYVERVLHDVPDPTTPRLRYTVVRATSESLAYGVTALLLSCALAAAGLWYRRLPRGSLARAGRLLAPPARALHAVHSGIVGDYVLWICAGTVVLGGVWAFTLR